MRIVQFTNCLGHAGAERVVQLLCTEMDARGHQLLAVSLLPPMASRLVDNLDAAGIPHRYLDVTKRRPWGMLAFGGIVRDFGADVVHSHLFHSNLTARLAAGVAERRGTRDWTLVNTLHSTEYGPNRDWYFSVDRHTLRWCDVQTAVSSAVAEFHGERLHVPPADFPVVYNGTETPELLSAEQIADVRRGWGLLHCDVVVGSVGRLDVAKGYDLLLQAAPHLDALVPDGERWGLVVIGEGDQRDMLEAILARQRLERLEVRLPGFRPDADWAMGAFDLFVMPSRFEGFGMTLAEAMSHGLPAITSPLEPLRELIDTYDNGLYWDEGLDAAGLAGLIHRWARTPRTEPSHVFSVGQMAEEYLSIYERTLNRIRR